VTPEDPLTAPLGMVAGVTGAAPVHFSIGRQRVPADVRVKQFIDARCLQHGGFNHRVAECAGWNMGWEF